MKTKLIALVMGVMIMTSSQISANMYKECGLGAIVFGDSMEGVPAAVSNVTWDLGTTASSSKSSGTCALSGNDMAAAIFIMETYPTLVIDAAKGEGAHLTTVFNLLGASQSRSSIVSNVQSQLLNAINTTEYSSQSRLEMSEALFVIINNSIKTI